MNELIKRKHKALKMLQTLYRMKVPGLDKSYLSAMINDVKQEVPVNDHQEFTYKFAREWEKQS